MIHCSTKLFKAENRICYFLFLVLSLFSVACKNNDKNPDEILLRIGNKELSQAEIIGKIPVGLYPEDSVALFQNLVEGWIRDELLVQFAEERLSDIDKINRMVNDYRNKLIVDEYLNKMTESRQKKIDEGSIKKYYENHKDELKTEMPLIKGVFVKTHSSSDDNKEIGRLLKNATDENIEQLQDLWMIDVVAYDYFKDRWIDWESVKGLIPFRFGDADKFLSENTYFETEYGDYTYFLTISDYLPTGSQQPYEFASHWISNILTHADLNNYETNLIETLIKKSIQDNNLEIVGYDPLEKKMINKTYHN